MVIARADSILIARLSDDVRDGDEESVAVTVNDEDPVVVGVPAMAPVEALRLSPAGRAPSPIDQV